MIKTENVKGSLEYTLDQQTDTRTSSNIRSESDSRLMTEQLNVQTKGDVFDPLLMSFTALGGFGLSQQTYSTDADSASSAGDLLDYGFNANFLPAKPYPFSIEATRTDRLVPRAFQSPLRVNDAHEGFNLNMRVPDWPMSFSWSESDLTQDSDVGFDENAFDRRTERFGYSLSHEFNDYSRMTFRSDIDRVTQTSGSFDSDLSNQRHRLLHYLNFGDDKEHRLDSSLSLSDRKDDFDNRTFDWSENLYLKHTDSFSTFYNLLYSNSTFENIDSQSFTGLAGFAQQLYSNLTLQADTYAGKSEFGSRTQTDSRGGNLNLDYRRNNPFGIFLAEFDFNTSTDKTTGETGSATVIDESHVFNDPFPFTLAETNIDVSTIVVTDATGLFVYTEGDDYTIHEVGNEIQITATTLGMDFPNITDGQTLLIDYLYELVGDRNEETTGMRFRLEQKFNNGLSLYFQHHALESDFDSELDPDMIGQETRISLYGAEYQWKPLTFTAEHTDMDSTFQYTKSDRLAVRTYWPLTSKTSLSGGISQTWIDTTGENPRDATVFRADARIRTRLSRHLTLSGRTEYRQEENSDIGPVDGYRVGASLDYNRGFFTVQTGWDTYFLGRQNSDSDSNRFYFNLIRRF